MRLAPWNRLKPSSNIFYWPFQGDTSIVYYLRFFVLCFSCFCVWSLLPCGHLLGKGFPLGSCWWCLLYSWYFPTWYPGSGVVLDCIVSRSLPPFLLCYTGSNSYNASSQIVLSLQGLKPLQGTIGHIYTITTLVQLRIPLYSLEYNAEYLK